MTSSTVGNSNYVDMGTSLIRGFHGGTLSRYFTKKCLFLTLYTMSFGDQRREEGVKGEGLMVAKNLFCARFRHKHFYK